MARASIRSHRDLTVWQRAIQLIAETYRLTARFPRSELYGIVSQMRRAAISIAANIAEGKARRSTGDYLRFLAIANGSLRELETYGDVSMTLGYTSAQELERSRELAEEVGRMLSGLSSSLRRRQKESEGVRRSPSNP